MQNDIEIIHKTMKKTKNLTYGVCMGEAIKDWIKSFLE